MNAQLANITFLVLLCSMICYWIGPLSRDLYRNSSQKDITKKVSADGKLPQENFPAQTENSMGSSAAINKTGGIKSNDFEGAYIQTMPLLTESSNSSTLVSSETNASFFQKTYLYLEQLLKNFRSQIGSFKISLNITGNKLEFFPFRKKIFSFNPDNTLQFLGRSGIILSNILLMVLLCNRWIESGHFPLSNLYESLMFLSWSFTVLHLFLENLVNSPTVVRAGGETSNEVFQASSKEKYNDFSSPNQSVGKFIGAITTPSALFTNAFATFTLPKEMQGSSALVPALQSNWLMMHVTVMIISYAALILGSLLSIAYLIITIQPPSKSNLQTQTTNSELPTTTINTTNGSAKNIRQSIVGRNSEEFLPKGKIPREFFPSLTLDNLSYRILGIGFPFLTIGILSGAVWANEAWGSYWSWDPKETWAFLTWLVYAIYLHTRLNKGWTGKKPAIIASLGFIVTWICYLGVNLIGEGLHSYGWIIK